MYKKIIKNVHFATQLNNVCILLINFKILRKISYARFNG